MFFYDDYYITETADGIVLEIDVPGFSQGDISIITERRALKIKGEQKNGRKRTLSRTFTLPEYVNLDGTTAEMKDGVLRIVLAKAEALKPRQIEIRTVQALA